MDPCIPVALNEIYTKQAKPTTNTSNKTDMIMNYLHTYPNAVIRSTPATLSSKFTPTSYYPKPKAASPSISTWDGKTIRPE